VRQVALTSGALFAGLALIVILASIRVRFDPHGSGAEEVRVVQLLGGSAAFLLVPRALAGAVSGGAAAVLAALALWLGLVGGALAGASRVAP
jgi:cell division protein FtsX